MICLFLLTILVPWIVPIPLNNQSNATDVDIWPLLAGDEHRVKFTNSTHDLLSGKVVYVSGKPVTSASKASSIVHATIQVDGESAMTPLQYKMRHSKETQKLHKLNKSRSHKHRKTHKAAAYINGTDPIIIHLNNTL